MTLAAFVDSTVAVAAVEVAATAWAVLWLTLAVAVAVLLVDRCVSKEKRPTILAMISRRASPLSSSLFCVLRGDGRPGIVSIIADSVLLCPPGIEVCGVSLSLGNMRDGGGDTVGLKVVTMGAGGDGNGVMGRLITGCTACWKAAANVVMEGKRASGSFARARKITASMAGVMRRFTVLGGGGGVIKCWYITRWYVPRNGRRPVSNS